MSLVLRKNLKFCSLLRLRLISKASKNCIIDLRSVCPRTGILSQNGLFATVAHNYKTVNNSVNVNNSSKTLNNEDVESSRKTFATVDKALEDIDYAVRRTGRTLLDRVNNVMEMIENEGFASHTQSLYLLRSCGLLKLEVPSKRIEVLHNAWDKLKTLGVQFDIKHYNALLKVYLDSNHSFKPSDILIAIEHDNIEPNHITYLYLMEKYCQDGDLNEANEILECIKEKGISVNQAVFHALIKGHMKANDVAGTKEVIEVMRNSNIMPTAETYTTLACGFAEKGDIESVNKTLSEAESDKIVFQNNNYLQIIESLSCNENPEFVDELLARMDYVFDWRQDVINTAAELTYKNMDSTAFKLIFSVCTPDIYSGSNIFIKQLIKANVNVEKVIQYCTEFYNNGINTYVFINAAKTSVEHGRSDHAIAFFDEMQKRGIPVRIHNFKNIFINCKSSPEVAWKYVQCMTDLGIRSDFFTYVECILPVVDTKDPEKVISKVEECGQTSLSVVDPLFQHYCFTGEMENALFLTERYPVRVNSYFNLRKFISLYDQFTENPSKFFQVLKYILENTGFSTKDAAVVQGEQMALFLIEYPKIFDEFHKTVGKDMNYRIQSIDICRDIVKKNSPSLMEHLRKFNIRNPVPKVTMKDVSVEEEDDILKSVTITPFDKEQKLMYLVSLHIKNKDIDRLHRVTAELETLNRTLPPLVMSQIFSLHCEMGHLDAAKEDLKKLKTLYPSFEVDSSKLFDYARLLLKYSRTGEVVSFLKDNCQEINLFTGIDSVVRSMRRFMGNIVQTGDVELTRNVQDALKVHAQSSQFKEVVLEPLLKIYLYRKDLESCLKEFNNCVTNYKCAPILNLLLKNFIMDEDQSKLQALVDLASRCEGNNRVLHELAVALAEVDRLQQAKKVIQNLGRNVNFIFFSEVGLQYYNSNKSAELENLLFVTAGLAHNSRQVLYHHLIKLYSKKNGCEKIAQVLDMMRTENMEPSDESKNLCNKLFKSNNQPLPFSNVEQGKSDYVPGDKESVKFLNCLKEKDVNEALKALERMRKGYVRNLPLQYFSDLVDMLVEARRLSDLSPNVNAMSCIIEHSQEVFKPILEKCAAEGNVEAMQSISNVFPDFALRKCSFNSSVAKAYISSNRHEDLMKELENRCNMKNKLYSINAFEELLKLPDYEDRVLELSKKYLDMNFDQPAAAVWSHYFTSGRYEKADEISKLCSIPVDKVDALVLRHIHQTENITMGYKYAEFVSQLHVRSRSKERAYGTLLDLLVLKQMYDDAVNVVMDAKSKNIDLEKHYQSTLVTLKSNLEANNKPVPFSIPTEIN